MALPSFTMRQLLEAGVHFGHNSRRWNPKMSPFIFGVRNNIHIIDLQQTVPMLYRAMMAVRDTVAGGGRVLFVGTKRQATDKIAEAAKRCGQYYVNHRWLGGMMTNWQTISKSIKRLHDLDDQMSKEDTGLTKKELLRLTREREKLDRALGGIKEMGGLPDVLFVVDTNKEAIAVAEANKLGIPVVGIIDSNSDPTGIDHPVPGNDDAMRSIEIYCDLMVGAVLDGIQKEVAAAGGDLGTGAEAPMEDITDSKTAAAAKASKPDKPSKKADKGASPEAPGEPAKDDAKVAKETEGADEDAVKAEEGEKPAKEPPGEMKPGQDGGEAAAEIQAEEKPAIKEDTDDKEDKDDKEEKPKEATAEPPAGEKLAEKAEEAEAAG